MALTSLELLWVQVQIQSVSVGLLSSWFFGLRVCVGLGFSDRSLGLGFRSSRVVFRRFNLLGYIGCLKNRHFKPQSPEASVI